jgi:hypothetical protein
MARHSWRSRHGAGGDTRLLARAGRRTARLRDARRSGAATGDPDVARHPAVLAAREVVIGGAECAVMAPGDGLGSMMRAWEGGSGRTGGRCRRANRASKVVSGGESIRRATRRHHFPGVRRSRSGSGPRRVTRDRHAVHIGLERSPRSGDGCSGRRRSPEHGVQMGLMREQRLHELVGVDD